MQIVYNSKLGSRLGMMSGLNIRAAHLFNIYAQLPMLVLRGGVMDQIVRYLPDIVSP